MANILPENETVTVEDQVYVNPETSLNEQNAFIDNLRATQQQNNAQIQSDTHNLGTDVPSNLGGLVGGEGYFTSRYQTPQTNSLVADLRSTAQAQALNQVLQNQQAMWKNRYNEAYRAAQKRARSYGSGGGGSTTSTTPYTGEEEGGYDYTVGTGEAPTYLTVTGKDIDKYGSGSTFVAGAENGTIDVLDSNGQHHIEDKNDPHEGDTGVGKNGNYPDAGAWLNAQIDGVLSWLGNQGGRLDKYHPRG